MEPHSRYQMLEKIGSGSFATVYRGQDLELGREVAIKQIHEQFLQDPQQLDRYWQEAQLLASFQHPNIVTIYDIVRDRGWLIMELMQGNLSKISSKKPMDLNALRTTLAHCLRALKFLHAHGIVHGDIKPGNMMIDRRRRVKIGDFGLARRVSDDEGSLIKGTTKYMAPEVVSDEFGTVGPASDLYSLGFAAYELMCGANFESLFPGLGAFGRDKQIAWMMWHAAPDRRLPEINRVLEDVPEDLARTIQKLTAKPQSERYQSADEALSDLNIDIKLVKTGGGGDEPPRDDAEARKKRMMLIGALSVSLLLSLIMLFMPGKRDASSTVETVQPTSGVVRKVFLAPPKLEIEDEAGLPTEVLVGEKPRIFLNQFSKEKDEYILLRDLKEGDRVEIKNDKDAEGRQVVSIVALRPERSRGQIKSIDVPDDEFVMALDERHEDLPLRVTRGAKVWLNGQAASIADLRAGDRVEVSHLKNTQAKSFRVVIRMDAFRTVTLKGFIVSLDPKKRLVTISQAGAAGSEPKKTVLELAENCAVSINGKDSANERGFGPTDLKPGDRVIAQHDKTITEIKASRRQRVSGMLTGIQEETPPSINVQTDEGKQFEFALDPACEVNLGGESAKLSDLRKNDKIEVTFDERGGEPGLAHTLDVARPTKPDRLAILIGEQNYTDRNLSRLQYSTDDAQLLRETLLKRYGVAPNRILLLANPTKQEIEHNVVEWLRKTSNLTQVLVYFSGHAYADQDGRIVLAPHDLSWKDLDGTGLRLDWLVEQLETCVGREKILMLDASHTGNGPDLARQPSTAEMVESLKSGSPPVSLKTAAIIASCSKNETGRDWPEKQHGLFARALADGFSGRADANKDLLIDTHEIFDYIKAVMTKPATEGQPTQTPALFLP